MEKKLEIGISDLNYNILTKLAEKKNISIEEMSHRIFHYGILWATGEKPRRILVPRKEPKQNLR